MYMRIRGILGEERCHSDYTYIYLTCMYIEVRGILGESNGEGREAWEREDSMESELVVRTPIMSDESPDDHAQHNSSSNESAGRPAGSSDEWNDRRFDDSRFSYSYILYHYPQYI